MTRIQEFSWSPTERFIFRFFFCYICFYLLFISDFFYFFPLQSFVHHPFNFVTVQIVKFINHLFVHEPVDDSPYVGAGNNIWQLMAIVFFLFLSAIIATIWSILDSRKSYRSLYFYLQVYLRYYLAFVLFGYGMEKLFQNQFPEPPPSFLMQSFGNLDLHSLMWGFMGAAKSYNFFGGLMELIPALLLLHRRTATLGSLIALATLSNVLILNIAYDIGVYLFVLHLILFCTFISAYNARQLIFFVQGHQAALKTVQIPESLTRFQKPLLLLKVAVIVFGFGFILRQEMTIDKQVNNTSSIEGVYVIKDFYKNDQKLTACLDNLERWKRVGIDKRSAITVQFMNDSTFKYDLHADTVRKQLVLQQWNDSSFSCKLTYAAGANGEYTFFGTLQTDTISFTSYKLDKKSFPVLQRKGELHLY